MNERPELPLEVEGRVPAWAGEAFLILLLVGALGGVAGAVFIIVQHPPTSAVPSWAVELPFLGWSFAVFIGLPLFAYVGFRAIEARSGRVVFRDHSIDIEKRGRDRSIAWTKVTGYGARSPGFVQLHIEGSVPLARFAIPTPDDETRARVLAQLDTRAIPRRD